MVWTYFTGDKSFQDSENVAVLGDLSCQTVNSNKELLGRNTRGTKKPPWSYLPESKPLVVQASPTRWVFWEPICISVLAGVLVRGCIWLQWVLLRTPSMHTFTHFMRGDLWAHLPTPCWVFSSFRPKTSWSPFPTLLIYPFLPQVTCSCLPWWKSPQRETFSPCGRGEKRNSWRTERRQNRWVQKLFWVVGKSLDRCITSKSEYFEGDWSLNM